MREAKNIEVKIILTPAVYAKAKACARTIPCSARAWLSYQIASAVKGWKNAASGERYEEENWPSGWPKREACFDCGKGHDPLDGGHSWVTKERVEEFLRDLTNPEVTWASKGRRV